MTVISSAHVKSVVSPGSYMTLCVGSIPEKYLWRYKVAHGLRKKEKLMYNAKTGVWMHPWC